METYANINQAAAGLFGLLRSSDMMLAHTLSTGDTDGLDLLIQTIEAAIGARDLPEPTGGEEDMLPFVIRAAGDLREIVTACRYLARNKRTDTRTRACDPVMRNRIDNIQTHAEQSIEFARASRELRQGSSEQRKAA